MSTISSEFLDGNPNCEDAAINFTPASEADPHDRDIDFVLNGGQATPESRSNRPNAEALDYTDAVSRDLLPEGVRGQEPESPQQQGFEIPAPGSQEQEESIDPFIKALAGKRGLFPATLVANGVMPDKSFGVEGGFVLPYWHFNNEGERVPTQDPPGKQYCRIRLPEKLAGDHKYTQGRGSHPHIYTPHGVEDLLGDNNPFRDIDGVQRLLVQEGEMKALSVVEAGFPSVGLGGITSFTDGMGALHPELQTTLWYFGIEEVVFIGDTDAAINPQFAKAACTMSRQIGEAGLHCDLKVVTMPFSGHPVCKGIDDWRKQLGDDGKFREELLKLIATAIQVEGAL